MASKDWAEIIAKVEQDANGLGAIGHKRPLHLVPVGVQINGAECER
jgi:hypothetical protein